ncbi:hypothetical protein [Mumia zhuanghuii]|uniref:rhamnosyltransferase WsaF family glycosyltransferase n=1 Tax=Mumia zhuanghuii TaxID=2585211 RepID=UPI003630D412
MTSRVRVAAVAAASLTLVALVVGLLAPVRVTAAACLALVVLAVAVSALTALLARRTLTAQSASRDLQKAQTKATKQVRASVRELRRQQRQTMRVVKSVRTTATDLAAASQAVKASTARLAPLEVQVAALRKDVTALRTPPPKPPLTGQDSTSAGARALADLRFNGSRPQVVLLLQTFGAQVLFAGIRTAVLAAAEIARELGRPLRVVVFDPLQGRPDDAFTALTELVREEVATNLSSDVQLSAPNFGSLDGFHDADVWVATYWTTAWNLAELARTGHVDRRRVVYLVQDWEPGFYPWGDQRTKTLSTYDAGFHHVVNSAPLARYVQDQTGTTVDPARVFAPQLDPQPLREAAKRWVPAEDHALRVLFYARPSKPRNMFNLGLQTLRAWADEIPETTRVVVRLAGEPLGAVDLGPRIETEALGKVSYAEYYGLLAETDLGLALMSSPHPGHLALELPMAGIPTVTNPFEGYRTSWVDGLVVADSADARSLVAVLHAATASAQRLITHVPPDAPSTLGGSLNAAVRAVCSELRGL